MINARRTACSLVVLLLLPLAADAAVMCVARKGTTPVPREGAPIRLRTTCRINEIQVDPSAYQLQGPTGPQGVDGPTGPSGSVGPAEGRRGQRGCRVLLAKPARRGRQDYRGLPVRPVLLVFQDWPAGIATRTRAATPKRIEPNLLVVALRTARLPLQRQS